MKAQVKWFPEKGFMIVLGDYTRIIEMSYDDVDSLAESCMVALNSQQMALGWAEEQKQIDKYLGGAE